MKINNCEAVQNNVTQQLQVRHKATPQKTQTPEMPDASVGKGDVSTQTAK